MLSKISTKNLKFILFSLLIAAFLIFVLDSFIQRLNLNPILSIIETVFFLLATILCYLVITKFPDVKLNFMYLFYSYLTWFIGDILWTIQEFIGILPEVYYYDIFFIISHIFLILALYVNIKPHFKLSKERSFVPIFPFYIYVLFLLTFLIIFFITPNVKNLSYVINSIYPILDFIIIAIFIPILINIYSLESLFGKTFLAIAISMIIHSFGDILFFFSILEMEIFRTDILFVYVGFGLAYSNIFMLERE